MADGPAEEYEDEHEELGICCPKCDCIRWRVSKTKPRRGSIQRKRICLHCGHLLVTDEKPVFF